ncbi:class F sortase [Amycolatopsis sp. FDAARGOS 1241]|uniref:class F sortase n=1 Tax=Amycolatopsis sp. FDAARGOS 1241 TaxID=2778070 RepID=UPI00351C6A02
MQGTRARAARTTWVLAAVGAVVVTAFVAALLIFTGKDEPTFASGTAPVSAEQHPARAAGKPADPGRTPATVVLPAGGTAKLVAEQVGDDGALPIPQGLGEAAWWGSGLGADHGVTLLSGHVNRQGRTGPFDRLWRMTQGQTVTVTDTSGGRWRYRVDEVRTIPKAGLAGSPRSCFRRTGRTNWCS